MPKIEGTPEPPAPFSPAPSSVSLSLSNFSFDDTTQDKPSTEPTNGPQEDATLDEKKASKDDEAKEFGQDDRRKSKEEKARKEQGDEEGQKEQNCKRGKKGEGKDDAKEGEEKELSEEQKKDLVRIKKARHARYMRFSRSLSSTPLSCCNGCTLQ